MSDRIERFTKISEWLDNPLGNFPDPHKVLNQMLVCEQQLNLKLTNTRQPWNLITCDLATVAGQREYELDQPVQTHIRSGKVYMVIRETENEDSPFLYIPFTDHTEDRFSLMDTGINARLGVEENLSFHRTGVQDSAVKVVISPTPQEVLNYTISFYSGYLDRSEAGMTQVALMPELHDYLDMQAAILLLPYARWKGFSNQENSDRRKELQSTLILQYSEAKLIAEEYIDQINSPKSETMDYWNS